MESEGESIPLQDIETTPQSNVVLRRHRTSTSAMRRNVAIVDGTLVSSDSNFIHQTETLLNSEQQGENHYYIHETLALRADTEDNIQTGTVQVNILCI